MGDEYIKRRDVLIKLEIAYDMARLEQKLPISDLQHEVNLIKAADVQPVRHGRWIGITEYCKKNGYIPSGMGIYYWCSECDKEEQKTTDFCPNCGARMDGDTE